jgi:hypothetical protein
MKLLPVFGITNSGFEITTSVGIEKVSNLFARN